MPRSQFIACHQPVVVFLKFFEKVTTNHHCVFETKIFAGKLEQQRY